MGVVGPPDVRNHLPRTLALNLELTAHRSPGVLRPARCTTGHVVSPLCYRAGRERDRHWSGPRRQGRGQPQADCGRLCRYGGLQPADYPGRRRRAAPTGDTATRTNRPQRSASTVAGWGRPAVTRPHQRHRVDLRCDATCLHDDAFVDYDVTNRTGFADDPDTGPNARGPAFPARHMGALR